MQRDQLLARHGHLTLRELLLLYTGPDALPIPPELEEWVDAARKVQEIARLERQNRITEARVR